MNRRFFDRRAALRLSHEQLAEKAGVGATTVARAERGERIRPSNAYLLALALGAAFDELFRFSGGKAVPAEPVLAEDVR